MKEWNIRDYGAICSDRLQTEKIQKAIDDCFLAGGGRVVVPCGVYYTGGLRLRSRVELYLETGAILRGSRDPEDYNAWQSDALEPVEIEPIGDTPSTSRSAVSTSRWSNGLIRAFDAVDIAVVGEKGSYIDGQNCFDPEGEENYRGPHGMSFWRCRGIRLEGYTFLHSGNWCHAIFQSRDITVKNVSVYGGHDGLDLRTCDNVRIEDCVFNTGDDALAGFDNHDVVMKNCTLNTACQSVRFGGNNVLVENCVSDAREFGFRNKLSLAAKQAGGPANEPQCRFENTTLYCYYCDHRAILRRPAENIVLRNVRSAQAKEILRLEFTGLHRWCCNRSLRSVTFEDCTVEEIERPGMLWGDANEKVICVFKGCRFVCKKGCEKEPLFVAANFEKIVFEDCVLEGWDDPCVLTATEGAFEVIRSTPVRAVPSTREECFDAHPWGVYSPDRIAGRTFGLTPKSK